MIITNRKSIAVFIISFFLYLLSDIFISDAFLYLLGGIFGTIAKWLGITNLFYIIWLAVLLGLITLYHKIDNKLIKIVLIILLWLLLYLMDVSIYELTIETTSKLIRYFLTSISIFLKSLILSWIYGNAPKLVINKK